MRAAPLLRYARRRAGLSQRQLAARTGVAQPTIAQIERARTAPRFDTLSRLLEACEFRLALSRHREQDVDRSSIRTLLDLTPAERLELAAKEARNLDSLLSTRE